MRVEPRYTIDSDTRERKLRGIVLICESVHESNLLDVAMGKVVGKDGLISTGVVECRLSDGSGAHYLYLPCLGFGSLGEDRDFQRCAPVTARWSEEVEKCLKIVQMIDRLRTEELEGVDIHNDNSCFVGPNTVIDVYGDWLKNSGRGAEHLGVWSARFEGENLLDCLNQAVQLRMEVQNKES